LALVDLSVVEQRYRAVLAVERGEPKIVVAAQFGVSRQTLHSSPIRPRCGQDAGVTAAPACPNLGSLQGFVDLRGIHDLLEADDLAVLDGPDVREAG
jgi:hypothetical protein